MNHAWTKLLPSFIWTRLDGRLTLQKTIANTGWLFADSILRGGVGMFVGVWIARYLGPQQFGVLSYATAFVALFSAVATLGLDSIVIREVLRNPASANEIMGSAFILKLAGGLVTIVLTVSAISMLRPDNNLMHWLVGIIAAGMVFQAFDTVDLWFQSLLQSRYTVYAKSTAFILANIGKVVLVLIHASLIAFAWIGLAEIAIGAAGMMITCKINGYSLKKWRGSFLKAKGLLKDSWPLILSGIVVMLYMRIDQIMLGEMVGDDAVGVYSAAVRLSEMWYFVPIAIVSSIYPSIIELKKTNERIYHENLQKLYNLMVWISVSVAIPMAFFSNNIIRLLYGPEYKGAGPILSILIWAGIAVFLGVASSKYLLVENYTRLSFYRTLIGAVVNILLNLVLIPAYGPIGAAIATLISYFLATFCIVFVKKTQQQSLMMFRALLLKPTGRKISYD